MRQGDPDAVLAAAADGTSAETAEHAVGRAVAGQGLGLDEHLSGLDRPGGAGGLRERERDVACHTLGALARHESQPRERRPECRVELLRRAEPVRALELGVDELAGLAGERAVLGARNLALALHRPAAAVAELELDEGALGVDVEACPALEALPPPLQVLVVR